MPTKSILGIMSLLFLLMASLLAVNSRLVNVVVVGSFYTQPPGLVGYWNLDQGSGTIAYDSSGYNNHGTIYEASWTSGKVYGALKFDGLNDYVDCGNNATLDPTQGATIEAWVNFSKLPSAAGYIMAIAGKSGSGTDLDLQTEPDNRFKFYIGPGYVAVSNTVVETNKWYHIAGTYQANNSTKIYVNGVLEKTTSISYMRSTNPNKFCIGQSGIWPGRFFNGTIDEVKIYNRALSGEEIRAEYMYVSISPSSDVMDVGQSQQFTSSVSGGTLPYSYQWYLNGAPISGATSTSWTFTTNSPGSYNVYVNVTDNTGFRAKSNIASVTVNPSPSVTITPASVIMDDNQTQQFTSVISGGTSPYAYQWYLNGTLISGATSDSWTFAPTSSGSYTIHLNVTDSVGVIAISPVSDVTVNPAIPEFQPIFYVTLFMMSTLLSAILLRRKRHLGANGVLSRNR